MELTCLANPEPAYALPGFPESTNPPTSVGRRRTLGIDLQGNVAYGSSENVRKDHFSAVSRGVNIAYEEVRNGNVASPVLSNELILVPENLYATHCSQDSLVLHSNSKDRCNSIILFERRKVFGKYRKCGKQARDVIIALAALMSILLSGCVITISVTYDFLSVPSTNSHVQAQNATLLSDQCSCTPNSEWKCYRVFVTVVQL